ncbi:MAG: hypothetical protein GC186_07320 [Rhodobacteraceae bacterium]|nr:hypothetical protein [Paracoccaceae bacterium]
MARFVVDLGDIEMTKEEEAGVARAIQKAALSQLAELRLPGPFFSHFPPGWLGFILRKDLAGILEAEKQIGQVAYGIR